MSYRATAAIEQIGYPKHPEDSGPLLPTTGGGLICAKCHVIITEPDFSVLRVARQAHKEAGCEPINVNRPTPKVPADLSARERTALISCNGKGGSRIKDETGTVLARLGLITEERQPISLVWKRTPTPAGAALAALCIAAAAKPDAGPPMFDLGPLDPEAVARLSRRRR